jgi:single-stranded-DNA-specific exonuclease
MICLDGERGKGSCRSCGGFNLFAALSACAEHLEGFGGHALAAGLTIRRENIDAFRAAFADYYRAHAEECISTLDIDLCVDDPALLTLECVEDLERMEPCGTGNARPRLALMGAVLTELTPIGGGRHLRAQLEKQGATYEAVFFLQTAEGLGLRVGDCVDAAFYPQINEFRDRRSVQLLLCDLRRHDAGCEERILAGDYPAEPAALPRSDFETLWRALAQRGGSFSAPPDRFCAALCPALPEDTLMLCLKVFEDLGLLRLSREDGALCAARVPGAEGELERSALLARLRRGEA